MERTRRSASTVESGESGPRPVIEANGVNVIAPAERRGTPSDLFWPWCAANISVFGVSWGAFVLGFGLNLWQAVASGAIGIVAGFVLVGLVAAAGKRGSAPTLVLSRAAFGVRGNLLPGLVSYLLLVGWEIVLLALATLATATVFGRLGWGDGTTTKVAAFLVLVAVIVVAGIRGFDAIMRLQRWLTLLTVAITVGYIALTVDEVDWSAATGGDAAGTTAFIGALVMVLTGFGISWVNAAADYSRYLPRHSSTAGVVGWTTFGASLPVVVLVVYGLLLCASDPAFGEAVAADPVGALTTVLPTWYLLPFAVVAVGGLVAGAVLDIYSSGLTLLAVGLPAPRWAAAALDGVLMILGTIYVVWVADSFFLPFQGFLITLGVPLAAWCGIFLADLLLRRAPYDETKLFEPDAPRGYGSVRWDSVVLMAVGTVVGWGLVTNTYSESLSWQGYLLGPLGLGGRDGDWAYSSLGVVAALVLGFLGYLVTGRGAVRRQEALPAASVTPR
ncbi:purine-cytosine permease family protein [Nocardioides halotolerans]|uniref:purine-cytosine permease family protein n=1 Tax=Nocardioides halotolerans TaxID=433660 RepID=UPI0004149506|nr:cytosine permease [Nocardioides halotolerans]